MKFNLKAGLILLVTSCAATENYVVEPKISTLEQKDKFDLAVKLSKLGDKNGANDIYYSLAKQGYMPALELYAVREYINGTHPVFRDGERDKGCTRNNILYTQKSDTMSLHTHWAIEAMALQGDKGASYQYFNCQIKSWGYHYPKNRKGAIVALDYLAKKGDLKANSLLIDHYLSYYDKVHLNPKVIEPFVSGNPTRQPDIEKVREYGEALASAFELNSLNVTPREVEGAVESLFKVAATEYLLNNNLPESLRYYKLTQAACSKAGASSRVICEKAKERIGILEDLGNKNITMQ